VVEYRTVGIGKEAGSFVIDCSISTEHKIVQIKHWFEIAEI